MRYPSLALGLLLAWLLCLGGCEVADVEDSEESWETMMTAVPTMERVAATTQAGQRVMEYLYGLATAYHGRQMMAALMDNGQWYESGNFCVIDGCRVAWHWDIEDIEGNPLVENVLTEFFPYEDKADLVWWVYCDGRIVAQSGNALRFEAELRMPANGQGSGR